MSLFNEKLKQIPLIETLSLLIILFIIYFFLNTLNIIQIDSIWICIFIIFFFIFKLKNEFFTIGVDIKSALTGDSLRLVLPVVILNIFLSYGCLYLADYLLVITPEFNFGFNAISTGLISTIILSPICEELTFRGVFVSRLKLIVPTVFAVLVSSLLFASLHGFGSVISAFVFGICMAIVYLKTDNIFVPILAHFLNNVFAEAIVLLDGNHIFFTNSSLMCIMSVMAAVSFVLISVFIVREMKILNNNNL